MRIAERLWGERPIDSDDVSTLRDRVFRRNPAVVWTTFRSDTVLFHVERGTYESLSDVATTVWESLSTDRDTTFDTVLDIVHDQYELPPDVPPEQVTFDIAAVLRKLERARVIVSDSRMEPGQYVRR